MADPICDQPSVALTINARNLNDKREVNGARLPELRGDFTMFSSKLLAGASALAVMICAPASLSAAVVLTTVNANLLNGSISFNFMGGAYTIGATNTFPNYINLVTSSTAAMPTSVAAVRTVFGSPSTDFPNRGLLVYDANILGGYGSFPQQTTVSPSNGDNLLGLRVTANGQNYYGFLYTTNTTLNSYAFETSANTGINPNAVLAAPEPASWAMMIAGFGAIGVAMRRRKVAVKFA